VNYSILLLVVEFCAFLALALTTQLIRRKVLRDLKNDAVQTWIRLGYGARFGEHTVGVALARLKFLVAGEYKTLESEHLRKEYSTLRFLSISQAILFIVFVMTLFAVHAQCL
jgi:hypothetical protein